MVNANRSTVLDHRDENRPGGVPSDESSVSSGAVESAHAAGAKVTDMRHGHGSIGLAPCR